MGQKSSKNKKSTKTLSSDVQKAVTKLTSGGVRKNLTKDDFIKYFKGRPIFAEKIYAMSLGQDGQVSLQRVTALFEMIMVDERLRVCPEFKGQGNSSYSIIAMIFLGLENEMETREDLPSEKLIEFYHFFIQLIAGIDDEKELGYFDEEMKEFTDSTSIHGFLGRLERHLDFLPRAVYDVITKIPLDPSYSKLPKFEAVNKSILKRPMLALLSGMNERFLEADNLQLIYSSARNGSSFNRLCKELHGYDEPTIILIKHRYKETSGESKKAIIGAYVSGKWRDELGYFGDTQCALFTLKPKFKVMYAFKGKGGKSFVYMNSKKIKGSKYKVGLGLGGQNYTEWRLWLDDEMMSNSTVSASGKTYPLGELTWGYENKLTIESIEVWGMGNEDTLAKREMFRGMERDRLKNARKVDKKALLGDDFARENLLGKNFAHRNNMRLDMDVIKDTKDEEFREGDNGY